MLNNMLHVWTITAIISYMIWKNIKGYEGQYMISDSGEVKSLKRQCNKWDGMRLVNERILKLIIDNKGYCRVNLSNEGKHKLTQVHRLVASAYIPNIKHLPCVNHIDGNKINNNLSNLEWVSYKENTRHMIDILHKLKGNPQKSKNILGKGVSFRRSRNKYTVRLTENGIVRFFGYFNNLEDAQACSKYNHLRIHGITI